MEKYLRTRAVKGPWHLEGDLAGPFAGAVVIPSLAEGDSLFATLQSLALNPPCLLSRILIVVVINHREDAPCEKKSRNIRDLERLASGEVPPSIRLAVVDAASPGREMPSKNGGVGLARRIGLDLILPLLENGKDHPPYLACLDADTLVGPDYLCALADHFKTTSQGGAVLPFRHQAGETPAVENAITQYEIFLRHYVLGLSLSGSPYAFHTVGSAMACTAESYVRADGIPPRQAGEDFYFLQKLAKTTGVRQVKGTTVYPSSRPSFRVPFGTGRIVSRVLAGEEAILFYHPTCFFILRDWLGLVGRGEDSEGKRIMAQAGEISPHLASCLNTLGFSSVWPRIFKNHRDQASRLRAFHIWFDGLKTRKLIHALSTGPFPRGSCDASLPPLLELTGLTSPEDPARQLDLLRRLQGGTPNENGKPATSRLP